MLAVIGGSVLDGQVVGGVTAAVLVFGLPIVVLVMAWYRTAYALTDRRVLLVSGLFSRTFRAAAYDEVQSLSPSAGNWGNITFDTVVGRRGLLSSGGQRIVWSKVPYTAQVYDFIQTAFGVRAAEVRKESVRQALVAHALQNTITCQYCGGLIDIRSVNLSSANCPRCGAPLLKS